MQSRQVWLPAVEPVVELDAVLGARHCLLADPEGEPLGDLDPMVLIGPEGGWTERERSRAPRVRLGPSTLRAETACIAAATLLTARRAGIVGPSPSRGSA